MLAKRAGKASTAAAVRGRVEDTGEGMYRATYVANFAGTYEVHVTCAGAAAGNHGAPAGVPYVLCLRASSCLRAAQNKVMLSALRISNMRDNVMLGARRILRSPHELLFGRSRTQLCSP